MTYVKQFSWDPASRIKIPAQPAGEKLEEIAQANAGVLRAEVVLQEARPAESPLHEAFEWDDPTAAEEYRRRQALHLLACIQIAVVTSGDQPSLPPQRVYARVQDTTAVNQQSFVYVTAQQALSTKDMRQQLVRRLELELKSLAERCVEFPELEPLGQSILSTMDRAAAPAVVTPVPAERKKRTRRAA